MFNVREFAEIYQRLILRKDTEKPKQATNRKLLFKTSENAHTFAKVRPKQHFCYNHALNIR